MTVAVQTLRAEDDIRSANALFRTAMVGLPPLTPTAELSEPGRTLGAYLDGELIGTAESYTSWLVVPGGARLPHAAVTHVGVLPTHTRRGALTALLRRQLADIAERGEAVATLRASEGGIYERFGYGIASSFARVELQRRRARLRDTVAPCGPVRFVDGAAAWKLLPQIYATAGVAWTGAVDRPEYWWRLQESLSTEPSYCLVHGPAGAEDGFVRYQPVEPRSWLSRTEKQVVVNDFVATTPTAYRGLIRRLLSIDLVDTFVFPFVALDSPLRHLLVDERALRVVSTRDETWLRLVDVGQALAGRAFREAAAVVVEVVDPILPSNSGRYRIAGDGVRRVRESADVTTGVADLAAVYLGGTTWRDLAFAGRVDEHRPGAVADADALFATESLPFSGTFF
ncbi:GNAT family N-acetyltransferase [Nocardia beijingensis]|uniref:GNAT family N-acetyltransferase n=1 Tax=Nocardia beijingensis TaxID=95162 RepID=UPI0033E71323